MLTFLFCLLFTWLFILRQGLTYPSLVSNFYSWRMPWTFDGPLLPPSKSQDCRHAPPYPIKQFFYFVRQDPMSPKLALNSICSQGWPQTPVHPACVTGMLELALPVPADSSFDADVSLHAGACTSPHYPLSVRRITDSHGFWSDLCERLTQNKLLTVWPADSFLQHKGKVCS